jgi:hypothetical protein
VIDLIREKSPFEWAKTQLNLEIALEALGIRRSKSVLMTEPINAFSGAIGLFRGKADSNILTIEIRIRQPQQ